MYKISTSNGYPQNHHYITICRPVFCILLLFPYVFLDVYCYCLVLRVIFQHEEKKLNDCLDIYSIKIYILI